MAHFRFRAVKATAWMSRLWPMKRLASKLVPDYAELAAPMSQIRLDGR
jgi:hypothetical protein